MWWLADGPGSHTASPEDAHTTEDSLTGNFKFVEETATAPGLRKPQLGALHAILAHRSVESHEPITIVMPTGTGKTETMLAAYCHAPAKTLVIVPSDALRSQIASKFATLGILPAVGAVVGTFRCPAVLVLTSRIDTVEAADAILARANVTVATVQALSASPEEVQEFLISSCRRLYVDEAHHLGAPTWRRLAERFAEREVVQFTATPYREDGRHLGGRIAYSYPLRLAQKNGYFARVNYHSVVELAEPDRAVALDAIEQLRKDMAAGLDHLLMARVSSVTRAREVAQIYEELAPDLAPVRIDTSMVESTRRKHIAALVDRTSRIVVCVNMLGEGFDLPALKIAAIHDPQKSLAVTLQFIGRFTRIGSLALGEASAFVPLQTVGIDERLRRLYGEDADWNDVIQDLSARETDREHARSEFEASFGSRPAEIAMRSIHPKMSTATFVSPATLEWNPSSIYELFEDRLLTSQLGINDEHKVVWWVSREVKPVRWGEFSTFSELVHHLYVVHLDEDNQFLYINSSDNSSMHEDIARAVGGSGANLVSGEQVYRILSRVSRRVPTNVGLLDTVSRNRRFSMHVGEDVLAAWRGEGATKMKTNIFAHGFEAGRAVSFGASRKGRVWSHEQARDIHDWVRWVQAVGPTLTDENITLESVMSDFLIPEPARERPALVPLAIEWPYKVVATLSEARQVKSGGASYSLLDTELALTNHSTSGPLAFELRSPSWTHKYEFEFHTDAPPTVRAQADDGLIVTKNAEMSIANFFTTQGLLVTFEDEVVLLDQGLLLRPNRDRRLFSQESIEAVDWSGVDIRRESQGTDRDPATVQHRTIEILSKEEDWEVIVDDDGPGELADIVLLRRSGDTLHVGLVHCKFSSGALPGARIADLYDVCGQAMKMNRAKSLPDLLTRRILRREKLRQQNGSSGVVEGDLKALASIVADSRYLKLDTTVMIVQPGMSKAKASEDMRALLGATERFLQETHLMALRVLASD